MIQMDGGDRLRVTLLDRMSTVETGGSSVTGLTLEAILMAEKNGTSPQPPPPRNQSNQTLLDVIQREQRHGQSRDKTAWKTLREKLRLKRNDTVWISSNPIPVHDNDRNDTVWVSSNPIPTLNNPIPVQNNDRPRLGFLLSHTGNGGDSQSQESNFSGGATAEGRIRLGAVLAEERALSARELETRPESIEIQPARMSLMELLEENEGQMSLISVNGEEEENVSGGGDGEVTAEISCCVCMIRSKGAAFIPCGHTFCRVCSRELWVQRGNCPLCNTSIVEILDLF